MTKTKIFPLILRIKVQYLPHAYMLNLTHLTRIFLPIFPLIILLLGVWVSVVCECGM